MPKGPGQPADDDHRRQVAEQVAAGGAENTADAAQPPGKNRQSADAGQKVDRRQPASPPTRPQKKAAQKNEKILEHDGHRPDGNRQKGPGGNQCGHQRGVNGHAQLSWRVSWGACVKTVAVDDALLRAVGLAQHQRPVGVDIHGDAFRVPHGDDAHAPVEGDGALFPRDRSRCRGRRPGALEGGRENRPEACSRNRAPQKPAHRGGAGHLGSRDRC